MIAAAKSWAITSIIAMLFYSGCGNEDSKNLEGGRQCTRSNIKQLEPIVSSIKKSNQDLVNAYTQGDKQAAIESYSSLTSSCDKLRQESETLGCRNETIKKILEKCDKLEKTAKNPPNSLPTKPESKEPIRSSTFEIISPDRIKDTFESVIGHEKAKKNMGAIVKFITKPEIFTRIGAKPPNGIILHGPPGTGKTTLARALAGEVKEAGIPMNFIATTGAGFAEKYVGIGSARVKELFSLARANKPCIIFIDEIDALIPSRTSGENLGSERKDIINQFLSQMDGFTKDDNKGIYIIAATNLLEKMDAAAVRPGRFDLKVLVDIPDSPVDRKKLLKFFMKSKTGSPEINYEKLAQESDGFSQAELEAWVEAAALHAALAEKDAIYQVDFDKKLKDIK